MIRFFSSFFCLYFYLSCSLTPMHLACSNNKRDRWSSSSSSSFYLDVEHNLPRQSRLSWTRTRMYHSKQQIKVTCKYHLTRLMFLSVASLPEEKNRIKNSICWHVEEEKEEEAVISFSLSLSLFLVHVLFLQVFFTAHRRVTNTSCRVVSHTHTILTPVRDLPTWCLLLHYHFWILYRSCAVDESTCIARPHVILINCRHRLPMPT